MKVNGCGRRRTHTKQPRGRCPETARRGRRRRQRWRTEHDQLCDLHQGSTDRLRRRAVGLAGGDALLRDHPHFAERLMSQMGKTCFVRRRPAVPVQSNVETARLFNAILATCRPTAIEGSTCSLPSSATGKVIARMLPTPNRIAGIAIGGSILYRHWRQHLEADPEWTDGGDCLCQRRHDRVLTTLRQSVARSAGRPAGARELCQSPGQPQSGARLGRGRTRGSRGRGPLAR
jgi:hypothetical protein